MKRSLYFLLLTSLFTTICSAGNKSSRTREKELLFESVKSGNLEGVKQAIEQSADVTQPDEQGLTALH